MREERLDPVGHIYEQVDQGGEERVLVKQRGEVGVEELERRREDLIKPLRLDEHRGSDLRDNDVVVEGQGRTNRTNSLVDAEDKRGLQVSGGLASDPDKIARLECTGGEKGPLSAEQEMVCSEFQARCTARKDEFEQRNLGGGVAVRNEVHTREDLLAVGVEGFHQVTARHLGELCFLNSPARCANAD